MLTRLSAHTYVHTTYLQTQEYGRVPCNGLVYLTDGHALVMDTPTDDAASAELLTWITAVARCTVDGVVVTHFHADCLGGLAAFHAAGIPSYARDTTGILADARGISPLPTTTFATRETLTVGKHTVDLAFFGAGHTYDNIVAYVPDENVLFGGCLLKSVGSGKGNLADANVATWSQSVAAVKAAYPAVRYTVPGHGKAGGPELLDYTIELFRPAANK